jgi:hypothetical protein
MRLPMTKSEFEALTKKWREDTCFLSSPTQIMAHPAVEELVQAGDQIVPWIFEAYKEDMSLSWSDLLHQITEVNLMIPRKYWGYVEKIQGYWMRWWEKNKGKYTQ